MDIGAEAGRVVWHDLLTKEVARARRFYAELLGWGYEVEHATDFTWKPGEEGDYTLIVVNGQAHGGLWDAGYDTAPYWLPWVAVEDVDVVTERAKSLGAEITREPWDTPGVGRGSVIRDPQGATICPHHPTHDFPPPSGTFLGDVLVTDDVETATAFYTTLFGWHAHDVDAGRIGRCTMFTRGDDAPVAWAMERWFGEPGSAAWVACLATDDLDATIARAKMSGMSVLAAGIDMPEFGRVAILRDPLGAAFGLLGHRPAA